MDKYELFDKYLRGDLSDQETDELMLLLEDEALGRELVEYSLETKMFVDYGNKVKSKVSLNKTSIKALKKKKRRKSLLPVLVMAALLALAFLAYQFYMEKNRAVISGVSIVEVNRNGELIISSEEIQEGDVVFAKEASELTFEDGSIVKLSKETNLHIKQLVFNKVFILKSGTIEIKAAAQKIGVLKVLTSDAETEVVGTEFSVSKLKVGTLLKVKSGVVNFSNDKDTIRVTEGSTVYADLENGIIQAGTKGQNINWLIWNSQIKNDSDLYFYTDFIKGRHNGSLELGKIKKDIQGNYFLRDGIISFNGSEQFKSKKEITLFAWVKMSKPLVHAPILTKGDNAWRMQVNKSFPHVGYGGSMDGRHFLDSDYELNLNQWYMIHQVITENNVKVYVNGDLITDQDLIKTSLINNKLVMLGGNSDKKDLTFIGDIGEAGLFNRKLSQKDIEEMYKSGKFFNQSQIQP